MSFDPDTLFPAGLSDVAASAWCDFLHALALAADSRYLHQIVRYRRQHDPPTDPGHPWRPTHPINDP